MIGTIAVVLDGLLTLVLQDLLGVLAHGVVLFFLIRGYMAGREMLALERELAAQLPPPPPSTSVESPVTATSV